MRPPAWAAIVLLLAALPVDAKVSSSCAGEDDAVRRLACYDEESGRAAGLRAKAFVAASARKAADSALPSVIEPAKLPERCHPTALQYHWASLECMKDTDFALRFHQPIYLIGRYSDNPQQVIADDQQLDPWEAKFQLSLKARLLATKDRRHALWLGYTQQSNWQVGNQLQSRPFRETNYQPELMYAYAPDVETLPEWRLLTLAYLHESNGRSGAASRSWNRVYAQFGFEKRFAEGRDATLFVRPWVRVREEPVADENPDITDFIGHGDVTAVLRNCGHTMTMMGRGNLRTGKGAFQATYSSPPLNGTPLKVYAQFFTGYGESLIDYNWRQTTVGVGFAVNDVIHDTRVPGGC